MSEQIVFIDRNIAELWAIAIVLGLTAYAASRYRASLGSVPAGVGVLLMILMFLELSDPATAGGLTIAFGWIYLLHARVVSAALGVLAVGGFLLGRRRKAATISSTIVLAIFAAALCAYAESAQAQPMSRATPVGSDPSTAESFTFHAAPWECTVTSDGKGVCTKPGSKWRFRLPTDDGVIDRLYLSAADPIVFVYGLTDEDSDWASIVGFLPGNRRPAWRTPIPGLNMATPLLKDDSLIVASLAFVASIDRRSGEILWRHEQVYDDSGRTRIETAIVGETVVMTTSDVSHKNDRIVACYSLSTGAFASCPASSG
jgi:hypothetical protein